VAGALGRKIGDARTATMMRGITECRVELLTTRQKAKLPVPAVPNNSAESNSVMEYPGTSEARLSLSVTDMNVQLELPGDVSEGIGGDEVVMTSVVRPDKGRAIGAAVGMEPRRICLMSVAIQEDGSQRDDVDNTTEVVVVSEEIPPPALTDDAATLTGAIAIPTSEIADKSVRSEQQKQATATTPIVGVADTVKEAAKATERRKMLRDIDAAVAMREHLAATNPELNTTAAFLRAVCGRPSETKNEKVAENQE